MRLHFKLKKPLHSGSIELIFTTYLPHTMKICLTKQTFRVHLPKMLCRLMAAYTFIFYTLLSINERGSTACKNKLCVPQTQLSFQESPISINTHTTELSACQKLRTDRWLFSFIYVCNSFTPQIKGSSSGT